MKTFTVFTLYLITLIPITLVSQAPQKIDFQAIARDAEGVPIASQDIGVKISIVKDSIGGEVVYQETHDTITDISGLFTIQIGTGDTLSGNFSWIDWGNNSYFTQVGVDKDGGTNYVDMGAMEMVSVPYALFAERSDIANSSYWEKSGSSIFYNDGKVGIGTSNPADKLDVHGNYGWHAGDNFKLRGEGEFSFDFEDGDGNDRWSVWDPDHGAILSVINNQRVGIGTTSPTQRLHVIGDVIIDGGGKALRLKPSGSDHTFLELYADSEDPDVRSGYIGFPNGGSNRLDISNEMSSGDIAIMVAGGNVGVETTSPTQRLDVNGNARFRSIGSGASAGALSRTSNGTLTTQSSDIRMKSNIIPLQNSLEKIEKLQGVTFTWIDDPDMGQQVGMIAQEVEKVLPELVFTNNVDGYKGINYSELTAVLVEAIKEQQSQIEEMKKMILEIQQNK